MYKVIVRGTAQTDYPLLHELDGIDCQDNFSEYMDGKENCGGAITGGYLQFEVKDGKLWSVTTYESSRLLSQDELHDVGEYTSGQWSDGIGEGFEQQACHFDDEGEEVFISPWHGGQKITVIQDDAIYTNEDGQTIPDSEQVAKLVTIVMKTRVVVDVRHNKDFMIALAIENFKAKLDNNEGVENIESVVNDIEMPYDPEFDD
jgi:hypothetical protein